MKTVALLTDFGLSDEFVGVMKGVLFSSCDYVRVVDITHGIEPFNIKGAAILLYSSYNFFPEDTIFVVVVDPGVGTERKPIVLFKDKRIFIGPDNGVFSLIMGENTEVYTIEVKINGKISPTFHGRDIFIRAAISYIKNKNIKGERLYEPVKIKMAEDRGGYVMGEIVHFDSFGNALTDIQSEGYKGSIEFRDMKLNILSTFGDVKNGEILSYVGSRGFYELGINQGNFKEKFNASIGEPVIYRR